jgi:hypothetical protein
MEESISMQIHIDNPCMIVNQLANIDHAISF